MTGGEIGGKIEVLKAPVGEFEKLFLKNFGKTPLATHMTTYAENYAKLFAKASGDVLDIDRANMPVIDRRHIELLHHFLIEGRFNINPPFDKKVLDLLRSSGKNRVSLQQTDVENAEKWRAIWQGADKRSRVNAYFDKKRAEKLSPIQKQIYLDKVLDNIAEVVADHPKHPAENLEEKFDKCTLVMSSNERLIDGHHKWATMMILQPSYKFNTLVIDLDLKRLLCVTLAFTALIGNAPNH